MEEWLDDARDISENLLKLQIGGQKLWNVYTKSFLSFAKGIKSNPQLTFYGSFDMFNLIFTGHVSDASDLSL